MSLRNIMTTDDLSRYIEENADVIYVREQVNGKWGNFNLTELPVELALKHKQRFINEHRIPVLIRRDVE